MLGHVYELSPRGEEERIGLRSAPFDTSAHHDLSSAHELIFPKLGFHDLYLAPRTLELGLLLSSAVKSLGGDWPSLSSALGCVWPVLGDGHGRLLPELGQLHCLNATLKLDGTCLWEELGQLPILDLHHARPLPMLGHTLCTTIQGSSMEVEGELGIYAWFAAAWPGQLEVELGVGLLPHVQPSPCSAISHAHPPWARRWPCSKCGDVLDRGFVNEREGCPSLARAPSLATPRAHALPRAKCGDVLDRGFVNEREGCSSLARTPSLATPRAHALPRAKLNYGHVLAMKVVDGNNRRLWM
ncbi:hypothetical protein Dimus_029221 [Dionaea muscipula]